VALAIPQSVDDVALAIPRDKNDPTRGWQELHLSSRGEGLKDTPKAVGLKDGGVVAFRFANDKEDGGGSGDLGEDFVVEWLSFDDVDGAADDMDYD
jgi:hypothetical protein